MLFSEYEVRRLSPDETHLLAETLRRQIIGIITYGDLRDLPHVFAAVDELARLVEILADKLNDQQLPGGTFDLTTVSNTSNKEG